MNKLQVLRYHVDVQGRQVGVEFRVLDEATGVYEPAEPHEGAIQILPLEESVLAALETSVLPLVSEGLAEIPDVPPRAITSALHRLREARRETDTARQESLEMVRRAQAERVAAEEARDAARATAEAMRVEQDERRGGP